MKQNQKFPEFMIFISVVGWTGMGLKLVWSRQHEMNCASTATAGWPGMGLASIRLDCRL
jgi:hypothetical protein